MNLYLSQDNIKLNEIEYFVNSFLYYIYIYINL